MRRVAVVIAAFVFVLANARIASGAATVTVDAFPSQPRVGDLVTVQLRPFALGNGTTPAVFPKNYPWTVVGISPRYIQPRIPLRRSITDPYLWTAFIRFPTRGIWVLCVLNFSATGERCVPRSPGWQRVVVRARRAPVDVWQRLERPFHVPMVAAGARCPTTSRDPKGDLSRFRGFVGTAWGEGPAYPAGLDRGVGEPILRYADPIPRESVFFGSAWSGNKVLWVIDPSYAGPVLIRGRQLDGPNLLRFDNGKLPPREIRIQPSQPVRARPSYTRVRAPGCYAYQIDGLGFSKTIIFTARPVRSP